MYKSYIAQRQYAVVLDEVNNASPTELQAVRLLAEYLQNPAKRLAWGWNGCLTKSSLLY